MRGREAEHRVAMATRTASSLGNYNAAYDNDGDFSSNWGQRRKPLQVCRIARRFGGEVGWLDGTSLGMGVHDCEYRAREAVGSLRIIGVG